jgi:hypothetical protein
VISAFETNLEARAEPRGISDRDAVLAEHNGDGKATLITAAKRNGPMRAVGGRRPLGADEAGIYRSTHRVAVPHNRGRNIRVYALSLSHRFIWGLI